jgi:hypothetical protein
MNANTQASAPSRADLKTPEQTAKDIKVLLSSALVTMVIATGTLLGSVAIFG